MANTTEHFLPQRDIENNPPEYPATAAPKSYSFLISVRFLCITLVGFLGTINLFVIRANLSIALPCMVYISTTVSESKFVETKNNISVSTIQPGCVRLDSVNTTNDIKVPYTWSGNTRGIVNGAFFVGYFFSQIPASLLFKRFGGRMIMAIFIGISTVCNLLQHPLALLFGHDFAHLTFIILRFFNGIGSGCFFGIYPSILSNWLPKTERSRTISIAFSGLYVGIIICFIEF
jgi:MFS family permease